MAAGLEVEHFEIGLAESDEHEGWLQAFGDDSMSRGESRQLATKTSP